MNNSYWISTLQGRKKEYKKLENEEETQICIIGAGLTGLTCAYYLTKAGKKVMVLEKDKICNHTSRKYNSKNYKSTWLVL